MQTTIELLGKKVLVEWSSSADKKLKELAEPLLVEMEHSDTQHQKQSRGVWPRTPITFFVRPKKVIQETPPRFTAPFGGSLEQTPTSGAAQLARSATRPRART